MTQVFSRDDADDWDDGWSRVPHGLWTHPGLTCGEKILLGWLHSHTPRFLASVSVADCRRAVGSSQVGKWFDSLAEAGFLRVTRNGKGSPTAIVLLVKPWRALLGRTTENADIGLLRMPISDTIEEQGEDHPSSLRSEDSSTESSRVDTREPTVPVERQVAKDYWDWHVAERGTKPTIEFLGLVAVTKRLLKSGHQPDDILDAMRTARAWTAKSLDAQIALRKAERENTVSSLAVPAAVVKAVSQAGVFLREQDLACPMPAQHIAVARLGTMGYGVGESICRLAVALRFDPKIASIDALVKAMLAVNTVGRFDGPLDDYADVARRAWTNRGWRA